MKRFHYDKETGCGYLIKNNDIDGKTTLIPITWFEDRDKHCEKWKIIAKTDYITQIKEGIERSEKYITKLKKELNRIEDNE